MPRRSRCHFPGKPIPPPFPFDIKDKKEALLLLTHLMGDLHQPLHVGSVYLDAEGKLVDPDTAKWVDPGMDTIGGNAIQDQNLSLHHEWDDIPTDIGEQATNELVADAKSVPTTAGPMDGWPKTWATDTLSTRPSRLSRRLKFSPTKYSALEARLSASGLLRWVTVSFDDEDSHICA